MTMPPMDTDRPALWMPVDDVFHIKGRGTVVTGQLQGEGRLNVGDTMLCNGQCWQVSGIEQFRTTLTTAVPGATIGVLLNGGPVPNVLRGQIAGFSPGTIGGMQDLIQAFEPKKRRWRG